jgi:hypothetical protein
MDTEEDLKQKHTSMRLGKSARLFVKYITPQKSIYASAHTVRFE